MLVKDAMTTEVDLIEPTTILCEAARIMRDDNVGILPVAEDDRLVGMLSDRDIVVRAIAQDKDTRSTPVREAMSSRVLYCYDDQSVDEVAANMSENQVRRLPVLNRDKRLVGIVSLGDVSVAGSARAAGEALEGIAERAR